MTAISALAPTAAKATTPKCVSRTRARWSRRIFRFDHIGEVADLPVWDFESLVNEDPTLLAHLDLDTADKVVHASDASGASAPIHNGECTDNYLDNAYARRICCAKDGLKYIALQASTVEDRPIYKWLIDIVCGHDLAKLREVRARSFV